MAKRIRRLTGTVSATDILRHPCKWLRPAPTHTVEDWLSLVAGEPRTVACFLRADFGLYPRRLRQGTLLLSASSPVWRPYWSMRRADLELPSIVARMSVREPGRRERNVKSWLFQVVVCTTLQGTLEIAVPRVDVPVVTTYFFVGGTSGDQATTS